MCWLKFKRFGGGYMSVYMIATVRRDFSELIGFRLYDTESREIKDCTFESVTQYIHSGNEVVNLGLNAFGQPIGLNGSLDRYAKYILNIGIAGQSPLVVIKKYANGEYEVVNGQGDRARMSEPYLINYANTDGIANAQVGEVDGKRFIRPISGQFEEERYIPPEQRIERVKLKQSMMGGQNFSINDHGEYVQVQKSVEKVRVPEGVAKLSPNCFRGMKLKELVLPTTLKETSYGMVRGCSFKELKIPVGCLKISDFTFEESEIGTLYIAPTVKKIEPSAFNGSRIKKIVYYNRNLRSEIKASPWTKLELQVWKGKM